MKLPVLVLALAACGGSPKGPTSNTGGTAGTPVYQSVFTKGASWTLHAETKTTPPADMGQASVEKQPDITCTVTDVHEMSGASMATVTCAAGSDTNPTGNMPPAGVYASNASGLYYYMPTDPKAHGAPDPATLMIPATPAERKQEGKSADGNESWLYETKKEGDAWCGYYSSAAGDEGGWGICFDATGMVKSNHFQAGATTVETFYKR
jgi:hypothetical protein